MSLADYVILFLIIFFSAAVLLLTLNSLIHQNQLRKELAANSLTIEKRSLFATINFSFVSQKFWHLLFLVLLPLYIILLFIDQLTYQVFVYLLIYYAIYLFIYILRTNQHNKRQKKLLAQLPAVVETLIYYITLGYSLAAALDEAAKSCKNPTKDIISEISKQIKIGASLTTAIEIAKSKFKLVQFDFLAHFLLIQQQLGGDPTPILRRFNETVQQKIRLDEKISSVTSYGRFSAIVVCIMPILTLFVLSLLFADFVAPLTKSSIGQALLIFCGFLYLAGTYLIYRLTKLEL